jgi:hypothetical protein
MPASSSLGPPTASTRAAMAWRLSVPIHCFLINQSIKLFCFDEMLTHILVVLVLIVVVDQVSAAVRRRLAT